MAEIGFEKLAFALEATPGTAIAAPTHIVPTGGVMTPMESRYKPEEQRGYLAGLSRSKRTREWSEAEGEGGLDTLFAPYIFNMAIANVTTPTTPSGATNARLWTFNRQMTANELKTATMWWGDPNVQMWRTAFGMITKVAIKADGKSDDEGTSWEWEAMAQAMEAVTTPTLPADAIGGLIVPNDFEVWLDTGGDAVGTTLLANRVLRAEHEWETGQVTKFVPNGPGGAKTFSRRGVTKSIPKTTVELEVPDDDQFALYQADTIVKLRVRHNGPLIEDTFYEFVEFDAYGYFGEPKWGEYEDANRTIEFTIEHQYMPTWGTDLVARVQTTLASL